MTDPIWDALFVVVYQSTGETDQSDGIDPETDSDKLAYQCSITTMGDMSANLSCSYYEFHIDAI